MKFVSDQNKSCSLIIELIRQMKFGNEIFGTHLNDENMMVFILSNNTSLRIQFFKNYLRIYDLYTKQKGFIQLTYGTEYKTDDIRGRIETMIKGQYNNYHYSFSERFDEFDELKKMKLFKHGIDKSISLVSPSANGNLYELIGYKIYVFLYEDDEKDGTCKVINTKSVNYSEEEREKLREIVDKFLKIIFCLENNE